ncbi:Ankyrin repeat and BTB/POZ domain-containing protein 1 [Irineochytrium annulatum]|nr:Ankyrin repeat and BTB/POZ domain-containing protein 1 [Irineochytrium annulatum]
MDDDHPLFEDLCRSCREGDLTRVKRLVEAEEVPINKRDKWDSTPLFYASLCGHVEIVEYLLLGGAMCDPSSFEGERALYGALNNKIRNLLRTFNVTKALDYTSDFALFTTFLHRDHPSKDIAFTFPHHPFSRDVHAHRFMLAARSSYFCEQLNTRWRGRSIVPVRSGKVHPDVMEGVLLWCYTGAVEIPEPLMEEAVMVCKAWRLDVMREALTSVGDGTREKISAVKGRDTKGVQADLKRLADEIVWSVSVSMGEHGAADESVGVLLDASHPDVSVVIGGVKFRCHAPFLDRSEYFRALKSFNEQQQGARSVDSGCKVANKELSITAVKDPFVFACVIEYLYTVVTRFYAETLHDHLGTEEFSSLLTESCESTINREELDTVIFVDDLRWWIAKVHNIDETVSTGKKIPLLRLGILRRLMTESYREYKAKMDGLDAVLQKLGIGI